MNKKNFGKKMSRAIYEVFINIPSKVKPKKYFANIEGYDTWVI